MLQLLTFLGLGLKGLFFLGAGQLSALSNNLELCIYFFSPSAQLIPPDAKCRFVRLGVKYRNSCVCEPCTFAWASGIISPCQVICVYGTLRRSMACKHDMTIIFYICSWIWVVFLAETASPEPWVKDQQTWFFLNILDVVPRAGLVLRVEKLPAMKSSSWDGGRQRGRVRARRAGFLTILLVAQGWQLFLALVRTQWGA